ncbi:MAG TPA: GNAT family N-acetyltransferase [Solirubrobacteraceae bacterium]|nr:GNAT family N-acetyltransferase [Solirubrobacteraceae bacterium]
MERTVVTPARPADAAAVTEVVAALESTLYGRATISQADLEDEWSELDVARDVRLVRDGDRIVGYALLRRRDEIWRAEGYVHPDVAGRGIGTLIASGLERDAARGGARALHNAVLEADRPAGRLLGSLGYRAVRVFREMRIELDGTPRAPTWPAGLRVAAFDPERDAAAFHAAHQEAFADHWDHVPRDLASWSRGYLESERFDPALWSVVRAGDEIAAGTVCAGATYGGGWIHALFTRRPWRKRGVGAALLQDAFARLWAHGERTVGLGVDTANATGALALYARAGMEPVLGWVVYEKQLDDEHPA